MKLSFIFACAVVWRRCIVFLNYKEKFTKDEAEEFTKDEVEDLLTRFTGNLGVLIEVVDEFHFVKLKTELEKRLVECLEAFEPTEYLMDALKHLSVYNLPILKESIRTKLHIAVLFPENKYIEGFFNRLFGENMTVKSNLELVLVQLFREEEDKEACLEDYLKPVTAYNLIVCRSELEMIWAERFKKGTIKSEHLNHCFQLAVSHGLEHVKTLIEDHLFATISNFANLTFQEIKDCLEMSMVASMPRLSKMVRDEIEKHFIVTIRNFADRPLQKIKDCLEISMDPSMQRLSGVVRDKILGTAKVVIYLPYKWSSLLLDYLCINCGDDEMKEYVDDVLVDLISRATEQIAVIVLYFEISHQYNLKRSMLCLRGIIEKKIFDREGGENLKVILAIAGRDSSMKNKENSDCKNKDGKTTLKDFISSLLCGKNFPKMDHSEDNLDVLLHVASEYNLTSLCYEIDSFVENDFTKNRHNKYRKLAEDHNLRVLDLMNKIANL